MLRPIVVPKLTGFCIFNAHTGMYSRGSFPPRWRKTPKIWKRSGDLSNHLVMFSPEQLITYYADCFVLDLTKDEKHEEKTDARGRGVSSQVDARIRIQLIRASGWPCRELQIRSAVGSTPTARASGT